VKTVFTAVTPAGQRPPDLVVGAQPGKSEILEPSRLPMASIYFYSPHSQLFNGVLIIKKYYRGAELGIALIWDLMTQSRSQVGQEMCVTDVLKAKTCSLFTSPLSEFVDVTFILWFLP